VLAEKLHMTVGELSERMSSSEISEWIIVFQQRAAAEKKAEQLSNSRRR